jgi:hypothetical protein
MMIGCGQRITIEPASTLISPASSFAVTYSPIATITRDVPETDILQPTNTLPAYTLSPAKTAEPTKPLGLTPTIPEATMAALMTAKPHLPICNPGTAWELSPDGQWIVDLCEREHRDGPYYLKAVNIIDGREWRVDFDMEKYGIDGGLSPAYWTSDGKYLYIAVFRLLDGETLIYWNGSALLRLNLTTGETVGILPLSTYAFSFSPNDQLAYIARPWNSPQKMDILDPHTWKVHRISLGEYCGVGQILWAPTEDRIVFQAATCKNEFLDIVSYSLVLLNLDDGSQKQLLVSLDELPRPLEWKNEFPLYIDRDYTYSGKDKCWVLNLEVGELLPIACPQTSGS